MVFAFSIYISCLLIGFGYRLSEVDVHVNSAGGATDFAIVAVHTVFRICRDRPLLLLVPAYHIEPAGLVTIFAARAAGIKFDTVHSSSLK
jgi:hypothetical protein